MTARDFAFWLQGVFEIGDLKSMSEAQTETVRKHLALVFKHDIDPSMGNESLQAELNKIHSKPLPLAGATTLPVIRC